MELFYEPLESEADGFEVCRHIPHSAEDSLVMKKPLERMSLRIIAGEFRTRKIEFWCDPKTRPMKDRTREAVMSLLGGTFDGTIAFDLFGGSGILGLEAVSRHSQQAIVFEILRQAVSDLRDNVKKLGLTEVVEVVQGDVFDFTESLEQRLEDFIADQETPWLVFCCPPYAMWNDRGAELTALLNKWIECAPPGSLFAVELEVETPIEFLPDNLEWDIRIYKPAQMAIGEKPGLDSIGSGDEAESDEEHSQDLDQDSTS